jgi:hypothetical protein
MRRMSGTIETKRYSYTTYTTMQYSYTTRAFHTTYSISISKMTTQDKTSSSSSTSKSTHNFNI